MGATAVGLDRYQSDGAGRLLGGCGRIGLRVSADGKYYFTIVFTGPA
jgi:hypothetical protein